MIELISGAVMVAIVIAGLFMFIFEEEGLNVALMIFGAALFLLVWLYVASHLIAVGLSQ